MPSMFENAMSSIRMGVEDYRLHNGDRVLSAVRNLYAGVLLLAKETLIRAAPNADPRKLIGAVFTPVPDGAGGVEFEVAGHRTIDFDAIGKRFKAFDLSIDHKALEELNRIRNDIEHHYTDKPEAAIRTAIARAFPVISSLFRQIDESPAQHLGGVWETMLQERAFFVSELGAAKATLADVAWHAGFLADELKCGDCGSELLEQVEPENLVQIEIELRCRNCGAMPDIQDAVEAAVDVVYGTEAYLNVKDAGGEGPIYDCPSCDRATLLEEKGVCANCGEGLDYASECFRCSASIPIQDYLDGLDGGLCGYCSHQADKVMQE